MELYTAFDLHANNNYAAIIDENGRKVAGKKLNNDPGVVLDFLESYREAIKGIVVESTFNWYWLVDVLMNHGYEVHLANTTAIQKYNGLKHHGDKEDAFWLAEMLRLGVLPQGYIYPKEERPIRGAWGHGAWGQVLNYQFSSRALLTLLSVV